MASATPLRYQLYALGGILLFTALIGASVYGVRAVGTSSYVEPACQKACVAAGGQLADVEFHVGKQDHDSMCVCTNGARIHSAEADTIGTLSSMMPVGLGLVMTVLIIVLLARRARAS